MGSSGGGGGNPAYLMMGGQPMPGLPIAGQGPGIDPFKYGKFQSFLPDIPSQADIEGGARAPSATGLTNEMFTYKGPDGSVADSGAAPGGATSADIQGLRDQLAQLIGQKAQGAGTGMFDPAEFQSFLRGGTGPFSSASHSIF